MTVGETNVHIDHINHTNINQYKTNIKLKTNNRDNVSNIYGKDKYS